MKRARLFVMLFVLSVTKRTVVTYKIVVVAIQNGTLSKMCSR